MKDFVIEYLKDSLLQAEDEIRNGAIIGSIVVNSYKEKFENIDFRSLEKALERSYTHKVAILSLSYVVNDKKIRKKYNSLIKNFVKDPYSSVRKAAAFSEPGFWGLEKKKNQIKKIRSITKDLEKKKLNKSYLEGLLLGIGINSLDFDPETYDSILRLYDLAQQIYYDEAVTIALCYGLSLFCVATRNIDSGILILNRILDSKIKRVRTSIAESLSFLTGFVLFNESLEIIDALLLHPAHHETWPLNLAIILTYLNNFDSPKNLQVIISKIKDSDVNTPEITYLLDLIERIKNPLQLIKDALSSDYSQLRLASLFSTYYVEMNKERLNKREEDFIKFADLSVNLLKDPSSYIRSFALYRLLSYSLSLNTDRYIEDFYSQLNDQLHRNRFISAVATIYLTAIHNPDNFLDVKNKLYATQNLSVKKGVLVGMAMGVNPEIHESDTADELILGLLELSGEDPSVGFILAQSSILQSE